MSPTLFFRFCGERGAEHRLAAVAGRESSAGQDLQVVVPEVVRRPAQDHHVDARLPAQHFVIDSTQRRVHTVDAGNASDAIDEFLVEVAGESGRVTPACDRDQIDPAALERLGHTALDVVADPQQRDHAADGDGQPEDGQRRPDRPPRQVLQDEREEVHWPTHPSADSGRPTRASLVRCRRTASVNAAVFSTTARCFAAGMISATHSVKCCSSQRTVARNGENSS